MSNYGIIHIESEVIYVNVLSILAVVLSPILSTLTTFAVMFFTRKFEKSEKERQIMMTKIEKLYAPFYQNCLRVFYPENDTFLNNIETASKFLDLFSNNISYMSNASQRLFPSFYKAFLDNFFSDNESNEYLSELNIAFKTIGTAIQQDYITLCKKLKLEPPLELF